MKPVPDAEIQRAYRVRIPLFLIGALLGIFLLITLYRGIATLNALDQVESDETDGSAP